MMDALESLQGSSSLDSKAERIARYKAERRRELAERYANLDESSSKHTRRDRHREITDTPDAGASSEQKPDVSSALCQSSDQRGQSKSNSKFMMDATPSSKISTSHIDENKQVTRSRLKHSLKKKCV